MRVAADMPAASPPMISVRNVTDPFYPVADVGKTPAMETDEELETGYGGATPAGDNLCNDYAQGLADGFMAPGRRPR